jgi:hypothetical protein
VDPIYYEKTPHERGRPRDEALRAWAKREAKSDAMESDLCRRTRQVALHVPTAWSRLGRVAAALAVYAFIVALVVGSLYVSVKATPTEPRDSNALAGIDGGDGRKQLPYFGPFRP